ncbi:hypothetical protein Q0Z83_027750 [Actinoplanes sichuanensis]|nr:hypothetical protein Q0Z83_027750 [Actinoplanes sichuanensis]
MIGGPRRAMAALAPAYIVVLTAALVLMHGAAEIVLLAVPVAAITAVPLFARFARGFSVACYTAIAVLALGGCLLVGVILLPAALPLLVATVPPALSAPMPHLCVAAILLAVTVTILAQF